MKYQLYKTTAVFFCTGRAHINHRHSKTEEFATVQPMATHTSTKPTSTQTLRNPPIVFKCINYQACKNKFLQGSLTFCKVFQGGLRFCKILKGMYIKCNITQSDNLTKCFPGRHFYLKAPHPQGANTAFPQILKIYSWFILALFWWF